MIVLPESEIEESREDPTHAMSDKRDVFTGRICT